MSLTLPSRPNAPSLTVFGEKTVRTVLATFRCKNVRVSPFKLRRIAVTIDKKPLVEAIAILRNLVTPSGLVFAKGLRSVVASLDPGTLPTDVLVRCVVDEGIVFKLHKPAGRGRVHPIRKRCGHVTIQLVGKGR